MSPAPWAETSHIAAAVIVTRAHCCLTAAGHCYVMLGTIKVVDKSVNDNSARRLHHCDVIVSRSGFGVPTGVPHSEVELQSEFKSFTAAHLGSNTNQYTDWTLGGTCIKSSRSVYAPYLVQSRNISISWICEFRVMMGIMTCLLGCCSSSTRGSRADDYCIIRPAASGAGRTTPSQPGHYPLNNPALV